MCLKTYLNHPIIQIMLRKNKKKIKKIKIKMGNHSYQKRGGGVRRGMIMIKDSMVFFTPSLILL